MIFYIIYKNLFNKFLHVGHYIRKWEPLLTPYLYGIYKKVHIINITYTLYFLRKALYLIELISLKRGRIFLNFKTSNPIFDAYLNNFYVNYLNNYMKKQLKLNLNKMIEKKNIYIYSNNFFFYIKKKLKYQVFLLSQRIYFSTSWQGGLITNFKYLYKQFYKKIKTIRFRIFSFYYYLFFYKKIKNKLRKRKFEFDYLFKNEQILNRIIDQKFLESFLLKKMNRKINTFYLKYQYPPQLLFNLNNHLNFWTIRECLYKIPTIGILDSNSKYLNILYPIPGNDDSSSSILFYLTMFLESFFIGLKKEYKKFLLIAKKYNFNIKNLKNFIKNFNKNLKLIYKLKRKQLLKTNKINFKKPISFKTKFIVFCVYYGFKNYNKKQLYYARKLFAKYRNFILYLKKRYKKVKKIFRKKKFKKNRKFFKRLQLRKKIKIKKFFYNFLNNFFYNFFEKKLTEKNYLKNIFMEKIFFNKQFFSIKILFKQFFLINYYKYLKGKEKNFFFKYIDFYFNNIFFNKIKYLNIYNFNKYINKYFLKRIKYSYIYKFLNKEKKVLKKNYKNFKKNNNYYYIFLKKYKKFIKKYFKLNIKELKILFSNNIKKIFKKIILKKYKKYFLILKNIKNIKNTKNLFIIKNKNKIYFFKIIKQNEKKNFIKLDFIDFIKYFSFNKFKKLLKKKYILKFNFYIYNYLFYFNLLKFLIIKYYQFFKKKLKLSFNSFYFLKFIKNNKNLKNNSKKNLYSFFLY